MCLQNFNIKSRSYDFFDSSSSYVRRLQNSAVTNVYAPCGFCEDCNIKNQYSWAWRLSADVQYRLRQGWLCGFVTLTYDEGHLPRLPQYFENGCENPMYNEPCFLKQDIKDFIGYIRKIGHRERGLTDLLYFVAGEFGKVTQRPHYHAILCWDPKFYSGEEMHALIKKYWYENEETHRGFITPKDFLGGENRKSGKKILPFLIHDSAHAVKSAFYCAKYVTKDIYFMRNFDGRLTKEELKELKEFLPPHIQTKSLGSLSIRDMNERQKLDLLLNGSCEIGESSLKRPPQYIQRKLCFKPVYYDVIRERPKVKSELTGEEKRNYVLFYMMSYLTFKYFGTPLYVTDYLVIRRYKCRVVRKELTSFMKKNLARILQNKVDYYNGLFKRMSKESYWEQRGYKKSCCCIASFIRDNSTFEKFGCSLGEAYLFYFGRKYEYCFTDKLLTYRNNYRQPKFTYSSCLIDSQHWLNIQEFFSNIMDNDKFCTAVSVHDEQADYVKDFYNQLSA